MKETNVISNRSKMSAMKAYVVDGLSLAEACKIAGVSKETLRGWLGDKVRPKGWHFRKNSSKGFPSVVVKAETPKSSKGFFSQNRRWSSDENEILRDALASGMTVKEVGDLLGRNANAIYTHKHELIKSGFISDMNFVMPKGIKRVRKSKLDLANPIVESETLEELVPVGGDSSIENMEIPNEITNEITNETPVNPIMKIELEDLAKLVKGYGVNIHVTMTKEGTIIKMNN